LREKILASAFFELSRAFLYGGEYFFIFLKFGIFIKTM